MENRVVQKIILTDHDLLLNQSRANDTLRYICWDTLLVPEGVLSVPKQLSEHSKKYRQRYLDYITDTESLLSERQIDKAFLLSGGSSLWWLGTVHEKSVYKSQSITYCLRLLALLDLIEKYSISEINIILSDKKLAYQLRRILRDKGVSATCLRAPAKKKHSLVRKLYSRMPFFLRGLLYFIRYWIKTRKSILASQAVTVKSVVNADLAIISYFPNMDIALAKTGVFYSNYWGKIHDLLRQKGLKVNWTFIYEPSKQCASVKEAVHYMNLFNRHEANFGHNQQTFSLLEEFYSRRLLWKTLGLFIKNTVKSYIHWSKIGAVFKDSSSVDLWPLFSEDVATSLRGPVAVDGILRTLLFEEMTKRQPKSVQKCIYLMENQAWEKALVYAQHKHTCAQVVGFAHASVRQLDFRYFHGVDYYQNPILQKVSKQIDPDYIAVNGDFAYQTLLENSVPAEKLVSTEAVRYLYLSKYLERTHHVSPPETLLVLTDIVLAASEEMLVMLKDAMPELPKTLSIVVKSHPFCSVDSTLAALGLQHAVTLTDENLSSLLEGAGAVFCSNATSAAIEAAYAGINTIVWLPSDGMNASPLLGVKGVSFVSTGEALVKAIGSGSASDIDPNYFYVDQTLPFWSELLPVTMSE